MGADAALCERRYSAMLLAFQREIATPLENRTTVRGVRADAVLVRGYKPQLGGVTQERGPGIEQLRGDRRDLGERGRGHKGGAQADLGG